MTSASPPKIRVDDVADVRAGDKGDTLILAVIARTPDDFVLLQRDLLPGRVARHFGIHSEVTRTVLPGLGALVFRIPEVLGGGVTGYAGLDGHGKSLSYHLLTLPLEDPTHEGDH
ncbi:AtuA-related protein [Nocardioides insulae]|uniref:AtuA-related protein n=1 Tax=Nocardioides insulae TaxID=394734 RepID=UPI000403FE8E|nr:hypothetical protein [Nocardioides insulae]